MEPHLGLRAQGWLWSGLFLVWVACVLACQRRSRTAAPPSAPEAGPAPRPPDPFQVALWLLLPACGTALLMGASNLLCMDVAAVPFLWVLPLALYLLTFIIAFDHPRWYLRPVALPLHLATGLLLVLVLERDDLPDLLPDGHPLRSAWLVPFSEWAKQLWVRVGSLLAALFAGCLLLHGELLRSAPHPRHLTRFYLALAAGGAAGGMAVALGAPLLLDGVWELHWALALTGFLVLAAWWRQGLPQRRWLLGSLAAAACAGLGWGLWHAARTETRDSQWLHQERTFYGVLRVEAGGPEGDGWRKLLHGTTNHGMQWEDPAWRHRPVTYYGPDSGVGRAVAGLREQRSGGPLTVAVLGLGTGTLATYGQAGDAFRFYEIDPGVIAVAQRHFTYLADSAAVCHLIPGDARLELERERREGRQHDLDLVCVDTFSSDAIPVHLLTREAIDLYWQRLRPDGLLALHTTNRHVELGGVVRELAAAHGLAVVEVHQAKDPSQGHYTCTWFVLARDPALLTGPRFEDCSPTWPERRDPLWTDDRVDLWGVTSFE